MKKIYIIPILALALVLSVAISGPKSNPSPQRQISWDSKTTEDLFAKACADCHSYETNWPWYSNIAPVSWFVIHNVDEGREKFNVSASNMGETDDLIEVILENKMPPRDYLLMHPSAKLSSKEKQILMNGLGVTFGASLENQIGNSGDDDDDDD